VVVVEAPQKVVVVEAPPQVVERVVVVEKPHSSSRKSGCGSRGGPGYRLANGRCASWQDSARKRH
jgi:hypothetical protein